jgi:hypothetical protein
MCASAPSSAYYDCSGSAKYVAAADLVVAGTLGSIRPNDTKGQVVGDLVVDAVVWGPCELGDTLSVVWSPPGEWGSIRSPGPPDYGPLEGRAVLWFLRRNDDNTVSAWPDHCGATLLHPKQAKRLLRDLVMYPGSPEAAQKIALTVALLEGAVIAHRIHGE